MDLEKISLSEETQTQKDKYCIFFLNYGFSFQFVSCEYISWCYNQFQEGKNVIIAGIWGLGNKIEGNSNVQRI